MNANACVSLCWAALTGSLHPARHPGTCADGLQRAGGALASAASGDLSSLLIAAGEPVAINWFLVAVNSILLLVLVCLSGAYSGSEAVLFSLSRVQLQRQAASSNPFRRMAARLMDDPKGTLMIVLLGNTFVNVLLYADSYVLFHELSKRLGGWSAVVSALVSIVLVMIGGEAIPKTLGVNVGERLAPFSAALINFSGYGLGPISRAIDLLLVRPIERLMFGPETADAAAAHELSTDELKQLLEVSRRHGLIRDLEDAFLREVIDLNYVRVRDVMVPRVEVRAYDVNGPAEGLRELIRATKLKKIPVYDRTIDNIVGLVYAKVLFFEQQKPLRAIVTPVRFVPDNITGDQLLRHFRSTRTQIAIVVDEYGGMAGLVTLEDVLEEIVGDIRDPEDAAPEPELVEISPAEYEISGRLSVRYWADIFGLPRLTERIATVGGLVMARLGRPARPGDRIRLANLELRVTAVHRRRVERLRIRLLDGQQMPPAGVTPGVGGSGVSRRPSEGTPR